MLFQTLLPRSLPFVSTGSISPELQTFAASALARTIADQRQHVIADGVRSLSPTISRAMAGYFPENLLRKCRYAIGDAQKIKLPTVRLTYGDGDALTLVDTVLF